MSARSLNNFIQAEPALKPLLRQLSELRYVQTLVSQALPPSLAKLGQVGSFRDGTLVLIAENGAAAAKLKQVLPELIDKISQQLQKLIEIRVSVQVDLLTQQKEPKRHRKPPLGHAAIQSLRKLAEDLAPSPLKDEVALLVSRQTRAK
jgi:hypothetical protein